MNKLLTASFFRLFRSKAFWLGSILMFAYGVYSPIMRYLESVEVNFPVYLEGMFFSCALFIAIIMSVFCSLFLGTEYSDGTVRNKCIVGHKRTAIYFTNLIVSCVASILILAAYCIPTFAIGLPLLGTRTGALTYVVVMFAIFLMAFSYIALFTMICMLCHNRTISSVICILGTFILLFVGIYLNTRLEEPETYSAYEYTDTEGASFSEEIPNPYYLREAEREICAFLFDFLPGGQTIQLSRDEHDRPFLLAAYSAIICITASGAGILLFRRKDIR